MTLIIAARIKSCAEVY